MTSQYEPPLTPYGTPANLTGSSYGPATNPFYTVANQFLPRNLHDVIRWSKYITIQAPVVTEVIRKLATYPVTGFTVDTDSDALKKKYLDMFESFRLREILHNIGFEYFTIGNVFISVYFPSLRSLICPNCGNVTAAKNNNNVKFKNYCFVGSCDKCFRTNVTFEVRDSKSLNIADMNVIKWDPTHISANYNPITGEYKYYYKIPGEIKRKVMLGDRLFVDSTPWSFIEAIRKNQDYEFHKDHIFHLRNISASQMVEGMAIPPLVSLFSLVFYQASLRKANESIASEFMAPLRIVYPAPQTANSDPVVGISMKNFVSNMQGAFANHRKDKSHVLFAPVPIGYQAVSGEGKALLVSQEIQQAEESILLSLGVSRELLSGTTNWTSSTVGLRLLSNTLDSYTSQILAVLRWISARVTAYLSMDNVKVGLVPFKLMDDDNLRVALLQLVTQNKASVTSLLETYGLDYSEELSRMQDEAIKNAKHQVETEFLTAQATFVAAKSATDKFDKDSQYIAALTEAQNITEILLKAGPDIQRQELNRLRVTNFPIYMLVSKLLEEASMNVMGDTSTESTPNESDKPGEKQLSGESENNKDNSFDKEGDSANNKKISENREQSNPVIQAKNIKVNDGDK